MGFIRFSALLACLLNRGLCGLNGLLEFLSGFKEIIGLNGFLGFAKWIFGIYWIVNQNKSLATPAPKTHRVTHKTFLVPLSKDYGMIAQT